MGFDRTTRVLTVPSPAATVSEQLVTKGSYIRPIGFSALLTGTDTAVKVRLTDADSRVVYLDASDVDYKTARLYRTPLLADDVATGAVGVATSSIGVTGAATQIAPFPVCRTPLTVAIINGGTAADSIDFVLDYEFGCFEAVTFTMPVAAASISSVTRSLKSKYAQILGFRALSVGTSTTQIMKITDVDGRVAYLDSAAVDYDTAERDVTLFTHATVTGLTRVRPTAQTGVVLQAAAAQSGATQPLVKSPITFALSASEGNDEVVTATVYYKTA